MASQIPSSHHSSHSSGSSPSGDGAQTSVPAVSGAPSALQQMAARSGWVPEAAVDSLMDATQIVLRRRFRVVLLVRDAYDRLAADTSTALESVWEDLVTMLRLLLAWVDRSYTRVPWTPLVLIAAAVTYFVLPVDAVPDVLGGLGLMDDAALITTVVQSVRTELDQFRVWEEE